MVSMDKKKKQNDNELNFFFFISMLSVVVGAQEIERRRLNHFT